MPVRKRFFERIRRPIRLPRADEKGGCMAKSENKRRTKGEGSLEFNEKKKKWVARITAHRADGSSFRKTFEGKTQKEAKSKRDEWLRHHKEESERIGIFGFLKCSHFIDGRKCVDRRGVVLFIAL